MNKTTVCLECEEEIKAGEEYKMVAIEQPYANVFFHSDCFSKVLLEVSEWNDLALYLAKKLKLWYNKE